MAGFNEPTNRELRHIGVELSTHVKSSLQDQVLTSSIPRCFSFSVERAMASHQLGLGNRLAVAISRSIALVPGRKPVSLKPIRSSEVVALSAYLESSSLYANRVKELRRRYPQAYQLSRADTLLVAADVDWRPPEDSSGILYAQGRDRVELLQQATGHDVKCFSLNRRNVYVVSNGYSPQFEEHD